MLVFKGSLPFSQEGISSISSTSVCCSSLMVAVLMIIALVYSRILPGAFADHRARRVASAEKGLLAGGEPGARSASTRSIVATGS